MRKKIYVSPSANRKNGYPNRYFVFLKENLAEYFDVLDAGVGVAETFVQG